MAACSRRWPRWRSRAAAASTSISAQVRSAGARRCSAKSSAPCCRFAARDARRGAAQCSSGTVWRRSARVIGTVTTRDRVAIRAGRRDRARRIAHRAAPRVVGDELSHDASCATIRSARASSSRAAVRCRTIRVCNVALTFDPNEDIAAPYIATGARPKVAILREQGVNSHVEMAAAFHRAGFEPYDVHMTDLVAGRMRLERFPRPGRVRRLLVWRRARRRRRLGQVDPVPLARCATRSARSSIARDTFSLGVCNGCQMMSALQRADSRARSTGRASCAIAPSSSKDD